MKVRIGLALLIVSALAAPVSSADVIVPGCADATHAGGEWRSYGHDLANTRRQDAETTINASNVANLEAAFVFNAADAVPAGQNGGGFTNTPIVADGCLFVASDSGWVFAVNADTGTGPNPGNVIWRTKLTGSGQTLLGGVIVGSPVVANGIVFVGVSDPGKPYVAALDEATGRVLWTRAVELGQANALINASPVHYDPDGDGGHPGYIFMGFAGNEGGSVARGGFAIVDASRNCDQSDALSPQFCDSTAQVAGATGGRRVAHSHTIDNADYARGYRGASIWCTAAIDPATSTIYACGGNPASKKIEHPNSNALLKIDGDPSSPTFGTIVDSYKGQVDQYYPGLDRQPVCDQFGDQLVVVWSLACLQLDLDFGSSPNLYVDSEGKLVLGALQKSGIYHAIFTEHMNAAWSTAIGAPCAACNASSTAIDGSNVYGVGTPAGVMVGFTRDRGRYRWAMPVVDGIHFQSVSTANGVVYTVDGNGFLNAFDAATGLPATRKGLSASGAPSPAGDSQGVAIARNTVYAANGETVIALR